MKWMGTAAGFHGEEATRASHVSSVGSLRGWSGRSLGWFIIGLRIGGCTRVQQFVPDDAASAAVLSTAQSHEWPLSALCGLARVMTG